MGEERAVSIISIFLTGILGGYLIKLLLNVINAIYNKVTKNLE